MLGTVDRRKNKQAEEAIDRLEAVLESIAYTAPEYADARRMQIVADARRIIREYRG